MKGALQRARATLESRIQAGARDRAPLPNSAKERELVRRFADAAEHGDTDGVVSLLSDEAWLTMPPEPYRVSGTHGHRGLPPRPRDSSRRPPPAGADPSQWPAGVRLLPPGYASGDPALIRAARPHARR